jgi:hypothetical protein
MLGLIFLSLDGWLALWLLAAWQSARAWQAKQLHPQKAGK